jgi:hypothetical protein
MATSFPTSKDNFANPQGTDSVKLVSHSAQHANANDAIEALETKVGVDGSTDPVSLEYRLTNYQPAKISFTPPTNPLVGHIWFDNETAEFYFFDGTYWIQGAAPQGTDLLHVSSNIIPGTDNTYFLGSSSKRWKGVYIGPGTIYITDTVTGLDAALTVTSGVLKIDGANQLQVGQLKFVDNAIESTTGNIDIQIGSLFDTSNLVLNRNVKLGTGKTLTFADNTVQSTAAGVPVSYSPLVSGTGLTFSSSIATGSYMKVGKLVHFRVLIDFAHVTNFGTGAYSVTLPFAPADAYMFRNGGLHDGTSHYAISGEVAPGSTSLALKYNDVIGSGSNATVQDADLKHNSPITMLTSYNIHLSGYYEAQ